MNKSVHKQALNHIIIVSFSMVCLNTEKALYYPSSSMRSYLEDVSDGLSFQDQLVGYGSKVLSVNRFSYKNHRFEVAAIHAKFILFGNIKATCLILVFNGK